MAPFFVINKGLSSFKNNLGSNMNKINNFARKIVFGIYGIMDIEVIIWKQKLDFIIH